MSENEIVIALLSLPKNPFKSRLELGEMKSMKKEVKTYKSGSLHPLQDYNFGKNFILNGAGKV